MESIMKIIIAVGLVLVGIYWAVSNPNTADSVKKSIDNTVSEAKELVSD